MSYNVIIDDIMQWAQRYDGPQFHALLCDPPYHLTSIVERFGGNDSAPAQYGKSGLFQRASRGFMGQQWDGGDLSFQPETWAALAKHLLPGAFGFVFAGSRGWHRVMVAIEDAGLIINPTIFSWRSGLAIDLDSMYAWVQSAGFPKGTRIDNQICRGAGYENWVVEIGNVELALDWSGHRYGTQALKPAVEPIIMFQKPFGFVDSHRVYATTGWDHWQSPRAIADTPENRLRIRKQFGVAVPPQYGENALSVVKRRAMHDGVEDDTVLLAKPILRNGKLGDPIILCRTGVKKYEFWSDNKAVFNQITTGAGAINIDAGRIGIEGVDTTDGRYPSNFVVTHDPDCSPDNDGGCLPWCPVSCLDNQVNAVGASAPVNGDEPSPLTRGDGGIIYGRFAERRPSQFYDERGKASRLFHTSDWILDVAEQLADSQQAIYEPKARGKKRDVGIEADGIRNFHPTVKPVGLTRHLASLLLPPQRYAPRRIMVPFLGSGSEGIGAMIAGWDYVEGIEINPKYVDLAEQRLRWWDAMLSTYGPDIDRILREATGKRRAEVAHGQLSLFDGV